MSRSISVDTSQLTALAADLSNAADAIGIGAARAVNAVATTVRKDSVQRVISSVNLKESYVDQKITIARDATPQSPKAVIEAPIRGVLLTNFDARQQSVANFWTPAMYAEAFGSLQVLKRPNPKAGRMPWTPRTGDALRGIAPGKKQDGIRAGVSPGGDAHFKPVFFITGKNGAKVTMERPKTGGKAHAMYGPSVDQVVKNVWKADESEIATKLGDAVLASVTEEIDKELKL